MRTFSWLSARITLNCTKLPVEYSTAFKMFHSTPARGSLVHLTVRWRNGYLYISLRQAERLSLSTISKLWKILGLPKWISFGLSRSILRLTLFEPPDFRR